MRTIHYVGPFDVVVIAATGQEVERGKTVEIDDDGLAESLCEQTDNWKPVAPSRATRPATLATTDGEDD